MSALSWATGGVLGCEGWATSAAYDGFICLLEVTEPETEGGGGGGIAYAKLYKRVKEFYQERPRLDFEQGKREITAKKVLREADREAIKAKVKEFKAMGIKAPEARAMIEEKIRVEIDYQRGLRITRLNDEALAIILIAMGAE